jgi:hypothetical protein
VRPPLELLASCLYTHRCSHRCQDISSCRLIRCVFITSLFVKPSLKVLSSCREELAKAPPVKPNSWQPLGEPSKSKVRSSLQRLYPSNKGSASSDRNLKGLKSIHERTQVSQNIKLSEGRRLLPQPKRKRQIDPNFDIQFTDLKNPELDDTDSNGMEYNSDDPPEAILSEPHSEMTTSSKVTKTNKMINSMPVLSSSSRMVNSDGHPTKRVKTTHSSVVSICSYLHCHVLNLLAHGGE